MTNTEATALSLAVVTAIAVIARSIPVALILPLLSTIALFCAFALAAFAWLRGIRRDGKRLTSWDVAGALALVGFAAAIMSSPETALAMFEQNSELTTASLIR